jgi:Fic family protein
MTSLIETPYRIEPCLLDSIPLDIADRIAELTAQAELLGARLHPRTAASLADLVRIMNCYYSNLIEGHNTKPRDIERALANDLEHDGSRRNLQIEARAHIRVQKMIDGLHAKGALPEPASIDFLCWMHREFYQDASDDMLWIENGECGFSMTPGVFRSWPEQDVSVGRHIPPGSDSIADFMRHFEQRYRLSSMGKGGRIIAMAAAHHRQPINEPCHGPSSGYRCIRVMGRIQRPCSGPEKPTGI